MTLTLFNENKYEKSFMFNFDVLPPKGKGSWTFITIVEFVKIEQTSNKSSKIEPQNAFNINDEILDIYKIQVWYGKKWTTKSEIFLIENDIKFRNTQFDKSHDLPVSNFNIFQSIGNMLSTKK